MVSPSVNPRLTEEQKQELAQRYTAGEMLPALVAFYRTWTANAKWAIRKYGGTLRPEDTQPRVCRVCGENVPSPTKRNLCPAHIRQYCSRCDEKLPKGRVCRWCAACDAANKERLYARGGLCSLCGKHERTPRSTLCAHCQDAAYLAERQVRLAHPGRCLDCQAALPPGRVSRHCTDCDRKHEMWRRRDRQRRGEHRCRQCGDPLRLKDQTYCKGCTTMIQNWRRAWHRGNEVARQLGTVESRRRWQREQDG